MRTRHIAITLILASLALLLLNLGGCGDETTMSRDDLASGNIRFALGSSQGQSSVQSAGQVHTQAVETPLDCTVEGISTIRAIVYGPEGNQLKPGGPWPCEQHQGLIEDVPAGTGRTVRILTYDSQEQPVKVGQTTGVEVVADETRNAGVVNLSPFVPQLISPLSDAEVSLSNLTLTWQPLAEASRYRLQIDEDINFSSPEVDQILGSTSSSPAELQGDTRYYWQVSALDSHQHQGTPSEIRSFVTVPVFVDNDSDGYSPSQGDCNDNKSSIYPDAPEICGDSIDQDCSGADETCPVDPGTGTGDFIFGSCTTVASDGDVSVSTCTEGNFPPEFSSICTSTQAVDGANLTRTYSPTGCNISSSLGFCTMGDGSNNVTTYTSATGIPQIDSVVSSACVEAGGVWTGSGGTTFVDADGDGYSAVQDCNDNNSNIHPGATEIPGNGIDENCNGNADDVVPTPPGTVTSETGRVWMDRNLGASQVATAFDDAAAYGDLYQWGRATDGHEKRTSQTTTTLSSTDTPGHGSFILAPSSPYDWRSPQIDNLWQGISGTNNPCPAGFRLPTSAEWEAERATWSTNDRAGAFASPLKLVSAGSRSGFDGSLHDAGRFGHYWSSSMDGVESRACTSAAAAQALATATVQAASVFVVSRTDPLMYLPL